MGRASVQRNSEREPTVEEVAVLVQRLNRQDQTRLLRLVLELQLTPTSVPSSVVPWSQADVEAALTYLRERGASFPDARPMQLDDSFLADLTVGQFLALPEEEQERLWDEAHAEAERELG